MREPERTVLWSADSVQPNNTSIELNDSIDNYDELIYYGSATRTYCPCVMTYYPVVSGQLNLGGPFFYGVWTTGASYDLCNGTQMFLSGNSGFVGSSYYWGKQNNGTAYEAALVNNRTSDVRPYKIVGVKYPKNDDRTVIWLSDHTDTIYNTNIQLSEPVTHFKTIEVLGSGYEASNVGCRHTSKNIYNTQPRAMGCDAWAYTPWKIAEKHNLVIGQELRLSGNSGHIGSGYYMGMGNQSTAWAAGKWTTDYQFSATAPYKIFGVDRKPVRKLTLIPPTAGGTQSASETSGYEYDQITMSNTPDEGWYFSGYNVTGATVNGNVITLQDQDASAQAGFTDEGFPITYQNDGHGTLTGDTEIGIPGQPINLTTSYNTYYRFSGYDVTGGYIQDGKLYATAPCTAKAVYKLNTFTASGGFEKGSDYSVTSNRYDNTGNLAAKYATTSYHTSNVPTAWYNTSNRWKVNSTVSAYQITLKPYMRFTMAGNSYTGTRYSTYASVTAVSLIGSTQSQSQTFSKTWSNKQSSTVTSNYSKNFTSTTTGVNYGLSAKLRASGYYHSSITQYNVTTKYIASQTTGTWVATGIIP